MGEYVLIAITKLFRVRYNQRFPRLSAPAVLLVLKAGAVGVPFFFPEAGTI
jgi:hypothetical protein